MPPVADAELEASVLFAVADAAPPVPPPAPAPDVLVPFAPGLPGNPFCVIVTAEAVMLDPAIANMTIAARRLTHNRTALAGISSPFENCADSTSSPAIPPKNSQNFVERVIVNDIYGVAIDLLRPLRVIFERCTLIGKSNRVRLSDVRQAFRIFNEIVELGHDPQVWRAHLACEILKVFNLQSSHVYIMPLPITAENAHIGKVSLCGLDDCATNLWREYGERGDLSKDPCTSEITRRAAAPFTAVRSMLTDDQTWYRSEYFNTFKKAMSSDDLLVSIYPMPEIAILHGFGGDRSQRTKPLGRRQVVCSNLIHQELGRSWMKVIKKFSIPEKRLSPRLAQLRALLMGLDSQKEIAQKMKLSPHTVHNHIRRLYRMFEVTSRAELNLLSQQRYAGVPRLGIAGL